MSKTINDEAERALTTLAEDEEMFRASVREFAEGELRPRVEAMDEAGKLDPALVRQCFDLGLMGIETPEEYGGAGASFFTAILAVDNLAGQHHDTWSVNQDDEYHEEGNQDEADVEADLAALESAQPRVPQPVR